MNIIKNQKTREVADTINRISVSQDTRQRGEGEKGLGSQKEMPNTSPSLVLGTKKFLSHFVAFCFAVGPDFLVTLRVPTT